ncbi:MAG: leucyl aminopeptidase [Rickettsiales bacterium]
MTDDKHKIEPLHIEFTQKAIEDQDTFVIGLHEGEELPTEFERLDEQCSGSISKAMHSGDFTGKAKECCVVSYPSGISASRIVLLGLGKKGDKTCMRQARDAGGDLYAKLSGLKAVNAYVTLPSCEKKELTVDHMAFGAELRSYSFENYFTTEKNREKEAKKHSVKRITFHLEKRAKHEAYKKLTAVRKGVFFARDVVTTPPNKLAPLVYAEIIKNQLTPAGVKVKIITRKQLEKMGAGALLGVGQGSAQDSCMVVMEYHGKPGSREMDAALIGKGVIFDTGGISIKPAPGMEDMKHDMAGSAAVAGAVYALALRGAEVNVVGAVGLVENMPDGNAQRPSDVVTSLSGQTVEVLNTDAEGRLVLADVLTYAQRNFSPKLIVDLATLTGAIVVSLAEEYAGLFCNNDALANALYEAGLESGEKLWRFPLHENYDKMIDSPIADMQNISNGRGAGSITAAQFLQRFIENDTPWAHLDIAGTAWTKTVGPVCPKGATGFGVRALDRFIENYCENAPKK